MRVLLLLLVMSLPAMAAPRTIQQLVTDAAARFPGHASIVFQDLAGPARASVRADEVYSSASLIKLPVLVTVFAKNLDAGQKLTLRERAPTYSNALKGKPTGSQLTVGELCEAMICQSDNTATDMLANQLTLAEVNREMSRLGLARTRMNTTMKDYLEARDNRDNFTTAAEMATLLQDIACHKGISQGSAEKMLAILKRQHLRHSIPARLPKGTVVANKTGELNGSVHDAGIVYTPKGAYVLCLLSRDITSSQSAKQAWAQLSLEIYQWYCATSR